eukprot:UN23742
MILTEERTYHKESNLHMWGMVNTDQDRYIGCFKDNIDRDLDTSAGRVSSVSECNSACKEYVFFGLQAYNGPSAQCWCGNEYESGAAYSQVDNSECAQRGSLDGARSGGSWRNAVYSVKIFNFQLRGGEGNEIVTITDGQETITRVLSTSWETFSASNGN